MALMEITEFPERVLKEVGAPVEKFDAELEKLVAELSLQEGVQAVHWYAGDDDDPMPRAH